MAKNIVTSIAEMPHEILYGGSQYHICIWNDVDGCYVGYRQFDDMPPLKKVRVQRNTDKSMKEAILELQKDML